MAPQLFSPLQIRGVTLKNRIAVSPMWQYQGRAGYPTDWHLMHLGRLADGGAALVMQEGTQVQRDGCGTTGDLGIWSDEHVMPLRRLTDVMRGLGAVPGIQLMHSGRKARMRRPMEGRVHLQRSPDIVDWDEWEPQAPSALPLYEGAPPPREMTLADIDRLTHSFVDAARRATSAGYEVIELHAGHGYLLNQFLSPGSNQRTDSYGGSFRGRTRLVLEVAEAVRSIIPDEMPLFVRISAVDPTGWTMEDSVALTRSLMQLGVDVIDCSSGGVGGAPTAGRGTSSTAAASNQVYGSGYGYQVKYASELRQRTGARTMTVGLIVHPGQAQRIVEEGHADIVALGRELLYNPNWPLDAAVKLGVPDPWALTNERTAYWLAKRADTASGIVPSTFSSTDDPRM